MARGVQKRAGGAGKTSERARYVELMQQGLSNAEICRQLGIHRKTGVRWRHGRRTRDQGTGRTRYYAPIAPQRQRQPLSARYLSEEERVQIADLRKSGCSVRAIAEQLGRAPSTISRELRRNSGVSGYRPFHAQRLAQARRSRTRPGKIASNPLLREVIEDRLAKRWSPAQISRHLATEYAGDPSMTVVHETIYQDLYRWRGGALARGAFRMLRTKRDRRRPSRKIPRRRSRFAGPVLMIDQRPFPPEDRTTPGAWEGDLVMGRQNRSAIATLVERTTRFTILLPIDAANRSRSLHDQLIAVMSAIPPQLRTSITWDQGWEMALHNEIAAALDTQVYFCDPHSPWQRGTNENTNRLVRDYFPKRSDLSVHSPERIAEVAAELNQRPRRVLDWATPEACFATLMKTYTST